jgi:thioredoxin reductase/NAD-dependent dihydropyrimidine dehydrogenase PreA subunit
VLPDSETQFVWALGIILALLVMAPVYVRARRRERETERAQEEALRYGLAEPVSLHPVVDPERCIGIGNCIEACPEGVLGFRDGQAFAVSPARCIGHGLCERVCPMQAIQLVFGTEKRGIELPRIRENFETNVAGLYIVGELGGMGLVANAFEQGRQCVEGIVAEGRGAENGDAPLDLVIVGCGPAGLSSALHAKHAGLRAVTLEREEVGGAVRHYPRKKVVMTRPVKVPGWGKLPFRTITKEELIQSWQDIARTTGIEVRTKETVASVERIAPHRFRVKSDRAVYESRRVILAIGRRGVPRKLGVPGEDSANVYYSLRDPDAFVNDRVLVVGGGDSAVEAALALSDQPGTEVRLSYRGEGFARIKPANHDRIREAIDRNRLEVLLETNPERIEPGTVVVRRNDGDALPLPADHVFVFIGGELPTPFLTKCGVELETHFGRP